MHDRGSMTVLVVLVASAITGASLLAVAPVLGGLHARQQARSAADAAALAGVTGGRAAAEALATRNGATVVGWAIEGGNGGRRVFVEVEVDGQRAGARATDEP